MTKRHWRVLTATLLGLGLAIEAMDVFSRGSFSALGISAVTLMAIGFFGNLLLLVKGW